MLKFCDIFQQGAKLSNQKPNFTLLVYQLLVHVWGFMMTIRFGQDPGAINITFGKCVNSAHLKLKLIRIRVLKLINDRQRNERIRGKQVLKIRLKVRKNKLGILTLILNLKSLSYHFIYILFSFFIMESAKPDARYLHFTRDLHF